VRSNSKVALSWIDIMSCIDEYLNTSQSLVVVSCKNVDASCVGKSKSG